jgi:chemosensory pili system protein ChpC
MAAREELYAVMISLNGDTLLLPNAAIAEVIARESLDSADGGSGRGASWLLGYCDWNSRRVPVICFEALNGGERPPPARRERLVVVNSLGTKLSVGAVAFLCQGYPHLVTLNRSALQSVPLRASDSVELVMARVSIANTEAVIPDFETLEARLAAVAETS